MSNKFFVLVLMAVMLMALAGCGPGSSAQINTPVPNTQAGVPTPNDQINVPGVSIEVPGTSVQINAPGPNPLVNQVGEHKSVASVLTGIWHGIISPVTLVVSFVNPSVQMYEVHNDGGPYNLGYLLGVAIVFLILGIITGSRRH